MKSSRPYIINEKAPKTQAFGPVVDRASANVPFCQDKHVVTESEAADRTRHFADLSGLKIVSAVGLYGVKFLSDETFRNMMRVVRPAQIVIKPYGWDIWFAMDGYSIVGVYNVRDFLILFFCSGRKIHGQDDVTFVAAKTGNDAVQFSANARVVEESLKYRNPYSAFTMESLYKYASYIGARDQHFISISQLPTTLKDMCSITALPKSDWMYDAVMQLEDLPDSLTQEESTVIVCAILREAALLELFNTEYITNSIAIWFGENMDISQYLNIKE